MLGIFFYLGFDQGENFAVHRIDFVIRLTNAFCQLHVLIDQGIQTALEHDLSFFGHVLKIKRQIHFTVRGQINRPLGDVHRQITDSFQIVIDFENIFC